MNIKAIFSALLISISISSVVAQSGQFQAAGGALAPVGLQEANWFADFKGKIQNTSNAADIEILINRAENIALIFIKDG
jgi:hypothetical protein